MSSNLTFTLVTQLEMKTERVVLQPCEWNAVVLACRAFFSLPLTASVCICTRQGSRLWECQHIKHGAGAIESRIHWTPVTSRRLRRLY